MCRGGARFSEQRQRQISTKLRVSFVCRIVYSHGAYSHYRNRCCCCCCCRQRTWTLASCNARAAITLLLNGRRVESRLRRNVRANLRQLNLCPARFCARAPPTLSIIAPAMSSERLPPIDRRRRRRRHRQSRAAGVRLSATRAQTLIGVVCVSVWGSHLVLICAKQARVCCTRVPSALDEASTHSLLIRNELCACARASTKQSDARRRRRRHSVRFLLLSRRNWPLLALAHSCAQRRRRRGAR